MGNVSTKIQAILLRDNAHAELENLVYELSAQGLKRQDIYNLFLQYSKDEIYSGNWMEIENKNNGDHPIYIILDRLSGWCNKYSVLLKNEPFETDQTL